MYPHRVPAVYQSRRSQPCLQLTQLKEAPRRQWRIQLCTSEHFSLAVMKKKIKLVNHSHEVNYYYSLWVREGVIFHSVKDYREWGLYRASVDPVWPGRDKLSLLVLFKAFKVTIQRTIQSVRESASVSSKLTHAWEKQHYEIAAVWCSWNY